MSLPPEDSSRSREGDDQISWDELIGAPASSPAGQNPGNNPERPVEAGAAQAATPGSERRRARIAEEPPARTRRRQDLDEYPDREKKSHKGAWGCLAVLGVFIALLGIGAALVIPPLTGLFAREEIEDFSGTGGEPVVVMIHEGDIGEDIALTLNESGVTASFDAFYRLLLDQPEQPVFQPGAYQLKAEMSARAALDALLDPASRLEQTVVIPEGTVAADVYQLLSEGTQIPVEEFQAAAADVASFGLPPEATSLEGFLFPATYQFVPGTTPRDIVKTLVDRQFQELDAYGVPAEDRWRVIRLASIVQREAGLAEDFPKVGRVFLNRLDQGWPLQSDATVTYGTGAYHRVSTTDAERADANNPYNTYVHQGLPPAPISNPGALAIDAVVNPAEGTWMFFVTWNLETGETIFSTTIEEHEAGVAQWDRWMRDHPEYQ